jgi:hypothetical protein
MELMKRNNILNELEETGEGNLHVVSSVNESFR